MHEGRRIAAVIVAAGRGERAGSAAEGPKQYRLIGGQTVVCRALAAFAERPQVGRIAVVIHPDDESRFHAACAPLPDRIVIVHGGATRQQSVLAGLAALRDFAPDAVLIHDAARPFADADLIARVIDGVDESTGALPALPVADTLKRGAEGLVGETVDRASLYAAQTPQGFPYAAILAAHERAARVGQASFTDDASIAEWAGLPVRLVEGSPDNTKLTLAGEIAAAEERLRGKRAFMEFRTGNGYDVHRLVTGDHVMLCGVRIDHDMALDGHSDADVGLHALTDALLATCGAGDIGDHFPPTDPQWRGVSSDRFLRHAAAIVRDRAGRVANVDVTLICEAPKIAPHRDAMRSAIADILGIAIDRVSVKATTNETIGFVGRREGIAAIATASVRYPGEPE